MVSHIVGVSREADLPAADVTSRLGPPTDNCQRTGLPLLFLQGYGILPADFERRLFSAPCPKVCVGSWLARLGERLCGLAAAVHSYSVRGRSQRLPHRESPRTPSVAGGDVLRESSHSRSTAPASTLSRVYGLIFPESRAVVFGTVRPRLPVPDWLRFRHLPRQDVLVEPDLCHNQSRVCHANTRVREGFGLPSVEAMACGCAIVTASNGGSEDYAIPGETAWSAGRERPRSLRRAQPGYWPTTPSDSGSLATARGSSNSWIGIKALGALTTSLPRTWPSRRGSSDTMLITVLAADHSATRSAASWSSTSSQTGSPV